jgi:hypothetical protein
VEGGSVNLDAEEQIREVLYPEERILWSGRSRSHSQWSPMFFLVCWSVLLMFVATRNFVETHRPTSAVLIPIAMAVAGSAMLIVLQLVEPRYRIKIAYGVTDERAIIVGGLFNRTVVSMPLQFMHEMKIRLRDDLSGTVVFADFWKACGEDGEDICPYEFSDIEDVQQVHDLIVETRDRLVTLQVEEAAS